MNNYLKNFIAFFIIFSFGFVDKVSSRPFEKFGLGRCGREVYKCSDSSEENNLKPVYNNFKQSQDYNLPVDKNDEILSSDSMRFINYLVKEIGSNNNNNNYKRILHDILFHGAGFGIEVVPESEVSDKAKNLLNLAGEFAAEYIIDKKIKNMAGISYSQDVNYVMNYVSTDGLPCSKNPFKLYSDKLTDFLEKKSVTTISEVNKEINHAINNFNYIPSVGGNITNTQISDDFRNWICQLCGASDAKKIGDLESMQKLREQSDQYWENKHGFIQIIFPNYKEGADNKDYRLNNNNFIPSLSYTGTWKSLFTPNIFLMDLIQNNQFIKEHLILNFMLNLKRYLKFLGISMEEEVTSSIQNYKIYKKIEENKMLNSHNNLRITRLILWMDFLSRINVLDYQIPTKFCNSIVENAEKVDQNTLSYWGNALYWPNRQIIDTAIPDRL